MEINRIRCKSILSKTGLYGVDYSANPYIGCSHSCAYCYAVFMKKFTGHEDEWGSFVDVKMNAPELLKEEVKKKKCGSVLLSSVTDPYQPAEKDYKISRELLDILEKNGFSVSVLTKNSLVLRDLDILKKFDHGKLSVGFTVNSVDERDTRIWEPGASSFEERLEALEKLHSENIPTYLHVGPWLEGITNLKQILDRTEDIIQEFQVENMNTTRKDEILDTVRKNYPDLEQRYRKTVSDPKKHNQRLKKEVEDLRKRSRVPIKVYID